MSDVAIKVEGLGKKYKIGARKSGDFRESFGHFWTKFWRRAESGEQRAKSGEQMVQDNGSFQFNSPTLQLPNSPTPQPTDFWALRDISFEIKQGEAVGIIGRNGAGKSTLLKILSRITKPTTGRFEINGRVSSLLEVGTGFHKELTGRENIFLNGTILGMKRREVRQKFEEIVDFSGVEKFIDTPVKHYSSGMLVRLAFSVAAHLEPEILVIDEVLAVGDAEFQKKCLGKMEDVTGQGRTVLFVSHNMGAVRNLCGRGILLNNGMSILDGDTAKVIKLYLDKENRGAYINDIDRSKKISFSKIELADKYEKGKEEFFHDEDIYIIFHFKFNIDKDNHDYNVFCMILDHNKSRVFSMESGIIKQKTLKVKIKKNFLTRGNYSLHAFINKPQTEQVDIAEDVCPFEIIDNGSIYNIHGSYDYGRVFPNIEWINAES